MIDFKIAIDKLCNVFDNNPGLSQKFYLKWGVDKKDFKRKIYNPLTHGGYMSKLISLNNLNLSEINSVLDIGPEMGLEVFMLSEFAKSITVCDPDQSNLDLIREMASHYINEKGEYINNFIEYRALGFNNNEVFSREEIKRYESIVNKLGHSLPAFYNVTSVDSINSLRVRYDLIFIHKILTTITRLGDKKSFDVFIDAVENTKELMTSSGKCSWTEPEFVFDQKGILNNISKINGVNVKLLEYVPEGISEKFIQIILSNDC